MPRPSPVKHPAASSPEALPAAAIARGVERWFAGHQRPLPWRATYDPYHVWVSEVMAQQTRLEVVVEYFPRFLERFPTLEALAGASEDDVVSAWSGLGYYRRARMLRLGAQDVLNRFGGRVPASVDELLSISGIGRYTAGAIASIAHGEKAPIVDGNIVRIVARLAALEAPLGSPALMREAWLQAEMLVAACERPRDVNQGLMEIGALICKPRNPLCGECPVSLHCRAYAGGRTAELPVPKEKEATRELHIALYLLLDRRGRVLMRRESGPLMTSLFHLPHGDSSLLGGVPLEVSATEALGTFRHTVTNRRITFELFAARQPDVVAESPPESFHDYAWIDLAHLDRTPHPSYVAKALRMARECGRLAPVAV
jgi:A/G-specific adenine glycosylase